MENANKETEVTVSFIYQTRFTLNQNAKLVELKKEIEKELLMKEEEYEIYLNGYQLVLINNDTTIASLIEQHNSNCFDLKHQLHEIKGFLEEKVKEEQQNLNNQTKLYEEYKRLLEI